VSIHLPVYAITVALFLRGEPTDICHVEDHMRRGPELLHHGIKPLHRPVELTPESMDGDSVLALA
jgi:hypothetical protein